MSWFNLAPILAAADWWDFTAKVIAGLAVVAGPTLVILLTRRGNKEDRNKIERTEVEKLYVSGTLDLIKHLQGELMTRSTELTAAKRKTAMLQEEVDAANRSFAAYQAQYRQLLNLLTQAGIKVPEETGKTA